MSLISTWVMLSQRAPLYSLIYVSFHAPFTSLLNFFEGAFSMILVSVQTLYIISSYYVVPDLFDKPEVFNPDRYLLTEHGSRYHSRGG